LKDHPLAPSD